MQIKVGEPLLERLGDQRSSRKILCLWHTELLNGQLIPGSGCYQGCGSRCRSPGGWEGHKKDTTSTRLTSEGKRCKLCTKQFNKYIWAHLRGKNRGCRITGRVGILDISCQRKCCPDRPKQILSSLSLPSHERFSLKQLLLYHLSEADIGHNVNG